MIDDKTRHLVAALLIIPVASKILEGVDSSKRMDREIEQIVDSYFSLRNALKRRFDEFS